MSIRRTAALTICAVIVVGGGATALAATASHDESATQQQAAAIIDGPIATAPETAGADGTAAGTGSTTDGSVTEIDAVPVDPTTTPSSSAGPQTSTRSAEAGLDGIDELPFPFGTLSTVPPGWTFPGTEDGDQSDDSHGSPFDISGMRLDSLTSLARSVGIIVGEPVTAADGSMTVEVTLPDDSVHTVWLQTDDQGRIVDASVDGTPIMEFVRQFLTGAIGRPHTTLPTIPPEWSLPD
jgi:hypothetical protein